MRRIRRVLALVILSLPVLAYGQTGKIAGTITDGETGTPLPGVNVVIDGTTQGTSTDLDGRYVIIGVRPGTYNILASFIGFSTQRQQGVRVSVDLTTTIDFSMSEEIILGEEIVVTAEAITVRKDLTSSEARITSETIDQLPVTELSQVLDLQAGVTTRNGATHIRGGRSSEVVILVDGVPVTDTYDGSSAIQLENDGIEELQVISGTFNAEYGNAMSGIINVVTKEGRNDTYGGSVKLYTGSYMVFGDGGEDYLRGANVADLTVAGIQYRDVDPYSYLSVEPFHYTNANLALEGPIVGDRVTLFILGRYFQNDGWLYGARLVDINGQAAVQENGVTRVTADSSVVPMNRFEKFSYQGNLKVRLNNSMSLNVIGLGSVAESDDLGAGRLTGFRWNPDGIPTFTDDGYDFKLKFTHLLGARTFYTLDAATFYRKQESKLFDGIFDPRYNDFLISPPDSVEVRPGEFERTVELTGGGRFLRGGTDLNRFERSTRSLLLKGDISTQIGNHHLVKGGFQARVDDLDFTSFFLQSQEGADTFVPTVPDSSSSRFNSFDNVKPIAANLYVQDKIEFENFIVNAGLRVDYFDSRAEVPADPSDPNIFNPLKKINRFRDVNGDGVITVDEETPGNQLTIQDREAYWWKGTSTKIQLSPRLGVAYPITEEGVIHFSYGLFFQIPTLDRLFGNFGYKIPNASGNYGPFGNPDLDAQKTSMYEIGFKQGFGDFVVDVTGYYRDVRSWISTSTLITTGLPGINYVIYANRDYSNTRGVTLSLSKRYTQGWGFDASYTFQVVEGSNSNPEDEFFASQGGAEPTIALLPLSWDQRHKLAGGLFVGGNSWGGSSRFRFESGFPYTPVFLQAAVVGNDVRPEYPTNSRNMPSSVEIDLSAYYEFDLGKLRPRVFAEVFNVLDRRNVTNVYGDTGEPDITLLQLQTGQFDPGIFVQPNNYREPRRLQVGLEFRF